MIQCLFGADLCPKDSITDALGQPRNVHADPDGDDDPSLANEADNAAQFAMTVGQIIVYKVSKHSVACPLQVGMGMGMWRLHRSRKILDLLAKTGIAISYAKVLRGNASVAEREIAAMKAQDAARATSSLAPQAVVGAVIPGNLLVGGEMPEFAADNIDLNDADISGKGGSHFTQIAGSQRQPCNMVLAAAAGEPLDIGKRCSIAGIDVPGLHAETPGMVPFMQNKVDQLNLLPDGVTKQHLVRFAGPAEDCDAKHGDSGRPRAESAAWLKAANQGVQEARDLLLVRAIADAENPGSMPSTKPYVQAVHTSGERPNTLSACLRLPILKQVAHTPASVWTTFHKCSAVADACRPGEHGSFGCTYDQQIYAVAIETQIANPGAMKRVFYRLGNEHAKHYLHVCAMRHLSDHGEEEILIDSGAHGETTAASVMEGKNWARSVRAIVSLETAMWRSLWPILQEHAADDELPAAAISACESVATEFRQDPSGSHVEMCGTAITAVQHADLFQRLQQVGRRLPANLQFYLGFFRITEPIWLLDLADDVGDWKLHEAAWLRSVEVWALHDRRNYVRWGLVCCAQIAALPRTHPDLYKKCKSVIFLLSSYGCVTGVTFSSIMLLQTFPRPTIPLRQ